MNEKQPSAGLTTQGRPNYRDLREWLASVEMLGELDRIHGFDSDFEIGAATEVLARRPQGRALLFDDIPGYPPGYRVLVNQLGSAKRLAWTWGAPLDLDRTGLVHFWRSAVRNPVSLSPRVVATGPVLDNVDEGEAIDLSRFPSPLWHQRDQGRYIGTACAVITRDPDTGWVNMGTYRVVVQSKNTLGVMMSPGRHGRQHMEKNHAAGKPCPITVSFGHDPLLYFFACSAFRGGESELDYLGGFRGSPVEVIMGDRTGLPIPAYSEIAIEGEIMPGDLEPEGPFGEFHGYYSGERRPAPVIRVKRLLYRKDPILCGELMMPPPSGLSYFRSITKAATIWNSLEAAGVPGVHGVWCHESGATQFFQVVAIRQAYPGHAKQAGLVASQCAEGIRLGRYVIVVDDDIDPTDLERVVWAMSTRSDPARDITLITRSYASVLDPAIQHRDGVVDHSSRAVITACRPFEWYGDFPEVSGLTAEEESRITQRLAGDAGDLLGTDTP